MEKGKFYTVLGVEGIELNRKSGLKVHYENEKVDEAGILLDAGNGNLIDTNGIDEEVVDEVADDIQSFIENGLDVVVEGRFDGGIFIAEEVEAVGVSNCDWDVDSDDADDDEDEENQ